MLLAAIGIDPNNSQYPVAFAVVEKENTSSWRWFLHLLSEDLQIDNPRRFTLISDRQKGLEKALGEIFPGAEIRFCVRHLHANFKINHGGLLLKQLLWSCARATTRAEFTRRMHVLKEEDDKAHAWLLKKDPLNGQNHISELTLNVICYSIICVRASTRPLLMQETSRL